MNRNDTWDQIVAETSARALPLSEEHFRAWVGRQGIFVSSLMDDEMTPHRSAVRTYLRGTGAIPLMWEEITPQDKSAQHAYLDGVVRATIFVLMLGRRYGVADASGASPTHREALRAAERHILRWLFVLSGVDSRERDVKLNDWLGSLYNELSGAGFDSSETLVARLDA
jgi:CRP-like cAMP-binding protein